MISLEKESDRQAMENVREFRKGLLCSICNEFLSDTYNLPCGHSFCRECIDDALAERNSCPDCMNPAWQKDTLKMALTDSTVQDWVANCERLYQAHVARQAARDGESSDTDSDLALVEASFVDDERGGTDMDDEEERGGNVVPIPVPSAPPQQQQQQQPPARQAAPENEGVVGAAATAAPPPPLPAAAELLPFCSTKVAEKENNAASGSWGAATAPSSADMSVAAAAPSAGVVGVERAAAWSSSPSSSSFSGGNRTNRVRFQPSPLRAYGAPSEAGQEGSGLQEEEASVHPRREKLPPAAAVTKPRDSSPLVLEGTVKAGDVVDDRLPTEGGKLQSTPAAAPLKRSVANTAAASPPGTESERRDSTPPRGTLVVAAKNPEPSPSVVPEKAAAVEREEAGSSFAVGLPDTCDIFDAESSPPHSPISSTTTTTMVILTPPTLKPGGPETKAAVSSPSLKARGPGAGASAACSAGARPGVRVEGGGEHGKVDGATLGGEIRSHRHGKDASAMTEESRDGERQSPPQTQGVLDVSSGDPPCPTSKPGISGTSAEGGTSTDAGVDGGGGGLGGEHLGEEIESTLGGAGKSSGFEGSHRPLPARGGRATDVDRSCADVEVELGDSGSEDEVSDGESVPLLGASDRLKDVNGQKLQQQQKQQHGSRRTSPSDGVPSPSSRSPLVGSIVGRPDETTVRHRGTATNDEDGEETCDEADSLSNCGGSGAALSNCGRGEQPTTGVEDERANEATSSEATGPSKYVDPSSSPSRVPLVLTNRGGVPKRPASHGVASGAAEKTSPAKGRGGVDSVRPACQAPTASPRHDKLFPDEQPSAAVPPKEAESSSTTRVDSPQPVSGSLQRQPQAFTAPSEASVLHHEQSAAKGDVLARRERRSLDGGELRVAETLPQTPGLGGDVLDKHAVVASPGDGGDTMVPETSSQGGLAMDVLEPNPPESLVGGVIADPARGIPVVEQPGRGGVGETFEGDKEGPNVARLEVPDSCVAHADGQEEHHASSGGTASDGFDGRGPVRAEQLGDKNTRGSAVAAAVLAAPPPGVKGGGKMPSSQAAPLQQRRSPENATTGVVSPGLKTWSSADGRLGRDSDEVPETLPSQRVGVDAGDGRGSSAAGPDVCLATQEISEQGEPTRCSDDHGPELGRRIPETAAQTSTTQEIQSLTTQEVPETAYAWGGVGACGGSSSSRIEVMASAASGSYSQSEVLEIEQLHGEATQSTADCAGGVGASGVGDGVEEQGAARFRGGAIAQSQQPQQPPPPPQQQQQQQSKSMPPSSSTLPAEAMVGGRSRDEVGGVKGCAGLGDGEKPGGAWASPGSPRADEAADVHGGVRDGGSPESLVPTERTPDDSGNRKRSADYATLSPNSRLSYDPGSAGKRTRLTLPPNSAANPSARPGAAASDMEASCNDDKPPDGGSPWQDAGRGSQQGRPIALRGGSGSPGSDDESEMPETDHDLAAVQDAWHAEGGYEFGDDGGYLEDQAEETESGRLPSSPAGDDSPPRRPRKNHEVDNPYAPQVHLDLSHGGDDFEPAASADGMMSPPVGGVEGSAKKLRSSLTAARRPSKSTMGFGSPSFGGAARASPSLSGSRFAASVNNSNRRPIKNKILAAGREHGPGGMTPASLSVPDKSGTWSSFNDLGPDTEEVENLQARVADKRAQEKTAAGSAAPETNPFDPSDAEYEEGGENDDDDSWAGRGEQNRGHRQVWDTRKDPSSEKKRKRAAIAAVAAAPTTAASEGKGTKLRREARHDGGDDGRPRRRRSPVLVVLLGCSPREHKRAIELCARLGQHRPETELVSGATHVVVGSQYTRPANSSSDGSSSGKGSGSGAVVNDGRSFGGHRELVKHEVEGYREAVLLGLWVLDFSWVDACLEGGGGGAGNSRSGSSSSSSRKSDNNEGVLDCRGGVSSLMSPPRDFELVGCSENHDGCKPRRGRLNRGFKVPGVFNGYAFCVIAGGSSGASSSRVDGSRSGLERLLRLGGGVILASVPPRAAEGFCENPFGSEDMSGSDDEVVHVEAGSGDGDDNEASAKERTVVVLAMPDSSDGRGVSLSLAKAATDKCRELGAAAAVDRGWALRSLDRGSRVPFDGHDVSDDDVRRPSGQRGGGSSKRAASRLSIPRPRRGDAPPRTEVLLDLEDDGGRRSAMALAVRADREKTARLLQIAEEVSKAPTKQVPASDPPPGFGADGFEFTRNGSKKKAKGPPNVTTFAAENKAQRDLKEALHKAGYLDANSSDPDKEHRLGEFWFDLVYDGFFMKRSENAIPEAKRRGCPVDVLRAEFESHDAIQTDRSRANVEKLPGEFPLWKAGNGSEDAVELL